MCVCVCVCFSGTEVALLGLPKDSDDLQCVSLSSTVCAYVCSSLYICLYVCM